MQRTILLILFSTVTLSLMGPRAQAAWSLNGAAVCTAASDQYYPTSVSDGVGGTIVTWHDYRSGTNWDIYAQRISADGATPTGVEDTPSIVGLVVLHNSPNPFSRATEIELELPAASPVAIDVFDVTGRRVHHEVAAGTQGWQHMRWNGSDDAGHQLASGVYFYRVEAAGETVTRKMVIAR